MNNIFYSEEEANLLENAVLVPIQARNEPIHGGHKRLIEFAKTIGDKVVVILSRNVREWSSFLQSGIKLPYGPEDILERVSSIESLDIPIVIRDPDYSFISDKDRILALEEAKQILNNFKDQVCLQRVWLMCVSTITSIILRKRAKEIAKAIVLGPEVVNFVAKASVDYIYTGRQNKIQIFPEIIRDPSTNLMFKTSLPQLSKEQIDLLPEIGQIMQIIRKRHKDESDEEMLMSLNQEFKSNQKDRWKFHEISIFEGGIFEDFRLYIITISLPLERGGLGFIEDLEVTKV